MNDEFPGVTQIKEANKSSFQDAIQRDSRSSGNARFTSTRWTLLQRAAGSNEPEAQKALSEIVTLYWAPLYVFARGKGFDREDARDNTQSFFIYLLEKSLLNTADPHKGRLRTFLLAIFQHFLSGESTKAAAWRRGGRAIHVHFDTNSAESIIEDQNSAQLSPDALYDRKWALVVINQAIQRMREECTKRGKVPLFDALRPYLAEEAPANQGELKSLARTLEMEEATLRVNLYRLRRRFKSHLIDVIGETLHTRDEDSIRDELQALCAALA